MFLLLKFANYNSIYYINFYNYSKMSLEILKKYNIKAKKSLWQNFLINDNLIEQISNIFDIKWKNIVEVWPGYWVLTEILLQKQPKSLDLVELDKQMIEILNNRVENWDFELNLVNFNINNIDVLKFEPVNKNYYLIANIPYYITSPILRHFLYEIENKPEKMLILMQKDVGDRIIRWMNNEKWIMNNEWWIMNNPVGMNLCVHPNNNDVHPKNNKTKSSVLSLMVAKKCYVQEELFVWKENFVPAPKVESSVLSFELHDLYENIDDKKFLKLIKIWFASPRKKLLKNFINAGYKKSFILSIFNDLSLSELVRAEDLNIAQWCNLILNFNI